MEEGRTSEPGRISLESLVSNLPFGLATFLAGILAVFAAFYFSRETLSKIPELLNINFGYDRQLRDTMPNRGMSTGGLPVTFVDVDAAAVEKWSPATRTTPREKISAIVQKLLDQKDKNPKLIFVDFDLSGGALDASDKPLLDYLARYPPDAPPLLLTRSLQPLDCEAGECAEQRCAGIDNQEAGTKSTGDGTTSFASRTAGKANVIWVASVFAPDKDGVVRSWRRWEAICREGSPILLPSPGLVASALASAHPAGLACLAKYLEQHGKTDLQVTGQCQKTWPANKGPYQELLPFIIGGPAQARVSDWMSTNEFRYQRIRAESLLENQVAETSFDNRVVVIGASYGPDKLATPLGMMPGAAVIANSIAVAPVVLDTMPAVFATVAFTLGLGVAFIWIAKFFRALPAAGLILALSYVWLSLATSALSASDAINVLSKAFGLLGVFLAIESLVEIAVDFFKGEGFRALLRHGHKKIGEAEDA
ncbi:CHASE2 domain-containing protein [Hyphomicrobium sp.]|jgi:hypothetical protein|uniref:CHASE2 domain-containing protein n=1 Tax=Hyphomicrobium sp. TaxID=82 RepID=UPI003567A0DB